MWKSVVGHNVSLKVAEGDDWETDPDFEVSYWDGGSEGPYRASVFTKALSNQYFLPVELTFCLRLVRNRLSPVFPWHLGLQTTVSWWEGLGFCVSEWCVRTGTEMGGQDHWGVWSKRTHQVTIEDRSQYDWCYAVEELWGMVSSAVYCSFTSVETGKGSEKQCVGCQAFSLT